MVRAAATFTPSSVTNYGIQRFREIQFEKHFLPLQVGDVLPSVYVASRPLANATREQLSQMLTRGSPRFSFPSFISLSGLIRASVSLETDLIAERNETAARYRRTKQERRSGELRFLPYGRFG